MPIKVESQETIPSLDIEYIQYKKFAMSVSTIAPYKISTSATVCLYGMGEDGVRHYSGEDKLVSISDVMAFVGGLAPADQADCAQAIQKINEGLGVLAEKTLGIGFVEYEA